MAFSGHILAPPEHQNPNHHGGDVAALGQTEGTPTHPMLWVGLSQTHVVRV